jgi:hypothetical protein
MARFVLSVAFLGLVVVLGSGVGALAQDFPYAVPQAPEFDERGTPAAATDMDPAAGRPRSKRAPYPQGSEAQTDYRTVRPYAPQGVPQPVSVPPTSSAGPISAPRSPSIASAPSPQPGRGPIGQPSEPAGMGPPPQSQPQGMPDCSHFPRLIASARSEAEMQMIAKEYLTCLMHSGWNMEQARSHVISTIETTYRLAR